MRWGKARASLSDVRTDITAMLVWGRASLSASAYLSASNPASTSSSSRPSGSKVEAFRKNLRDVQAFRRRQASLRIKNPFIGNPEAVPGPSTPLKSALSTLLASGAALGGAPRSMNPNYHSFIYGYRSGLAIIDLERTLPLLRNAATVVRDVVRADGIVLIVGSRPGMDRYLARAKEKLLDNGFVTQKWAPGLLTNTQTLLGLEALEKGGNRPDLVIFLNPLENAPGIRECTAKQIPTIGIVDTNMDPRVVTYPIPANGDSLRTTELILGTLSVAGQEGRRLRLRTPPSPRREHSQEDDP